MYKDSSYELVNWEINLKVRLNSKILNLLEMSMLQRSISLKVG